MKVDHRRRGYSRGEVAEILGVSQSRVSQIAKAMNVPIYWDALKGKRGFHYHPADVVRMAKRKVKPGPKEATR